MTVLVTSGPTRAYIDRVRYIANTSSGALGARIVETLVARGIRVIHLYGAGSEQPDISDSPLLESVRVVMVDDVMASVKSTVSQRDISAVVHAMAVLDYVPESSLETKKASGNEYWDIRLVRAPKVLSVIRELMPDAYTVGFKLEACVSEELLVRRAGAVLLRYGLDMVVANDLDRVGGDRHEALFIGPGDKILARAETKEEIARKIAECIIEHMNKA